MPAMAMPLSNTCWTTGKRRIPPVTISGMVAMLAICVAKSKK